MSWKSLLALPAVVLAVSTASADDKYVTLKGQIKYTDAPKAEVLNVTTDKAVCCKAGPLVSSKILVDPKSKGLANVVVYLKPDDMDRTSTFPANKIHPELKKVKPTTHVVDQPNCQFEPRIVVARDGDMLTVKNSATIAHNTNYSSDALSFNVTVPAGKSYEVKDPLKADVRPSFFKCDIHPWMEGRLFVFDHPYFAKTDKDGNFVIEKVPVGKWRIMYRHEGGYHKGRDGAFGFPIEVKADSETMEIKPFEFELPK